MANADGRFALTAPARMTFPHLVKARPFMRNGKPQGEPKFSANAAMPLDHADVQTIKQVVFAVADAAYPGRDRKELAWPWLLGDRLLAKRKAKLGDKYTGDSDWLAGHLVIPGKSKNQPRLAVLENGKFTDYDEETVARVKNKFYPGVMILAEWNFAPYEGVGNNPDGVTAYLNMVVTTNKGERLGTARSAADVFKGYVGQVTDEDPTGGFGYENDDEIPF